ncbi:hypothetical protein CDAR_522441 [Caerostris darwini]|uniref:Uncharacterized protein n=1 Tax=Caerostris darwini TaxID=1538125 RepID=A0AAV4VR86_9ARAC|nr:hypothetical protein CDAR_522441 [Caerostris darwini]
MNLFRHSLKESVHQQKLCERSIQVERRSEHTDSNFTYTKGSSGVGVSFETGLKGCGNASLRIWNVVKNRILWKRNGIFLFSHRLARR